MKPFVSDASRNAWSMAVVVFCLSAMGSAALVWTLTQRAVAQERLRAAALASDHAHAIQTTMERALSATYALAAMVRQGKGQVPDFEGVATEMLGLYPGVAALGLSPDGIIRRVAPLAGNEKSLGFNQLADPVQGRESRLARDTGQLTLAGPLKLVQGGTGVVGRLPVYLTNAQGQQTFWGLTYAVIRFPQALAGARLGALDELGLIYELWRTHPDTGERQVITASRAVELVDPASQTLELPNGQWTLSVAPRDGWGGGTGRVLMLVLGLSFSLLLAYVAKLLVELKWHERGQDALIAQRTAEITASQNKLQATLDAMPDLMLELDLRGFCHDYHASSLDPELPPADYFLGKCVSDVLPPEAARIVTEALQVAAREGHTQAREFVLPASTGPLWLEMSLSRKRGEREDDPRMIVLARNISSRKRDESELRVAATAFDTQEGMAITDGNGRILRVNPAFTQITGYSATEVVGRTLHFLNAGRYDDAFYESLWSTVRATGAWRGELWNCRKNGEVFPSQCAITAVRGEDGHITHCVNSLTDITQRKATEDEINKLAFYDPLTGLPNRRLLLDRLRHALAVCARHHRFGALQFIDLDNFKTLNDTLGHDMGDLLLKQVAQRLTQSMRQGDTVARLGGDEFVVMLEDLGEGAEVAAAQARAVGEKILAAFNTPYRLGGLDYTITPSIGVTQFRDQSTLIDELLKQADLAMYQAKAAGRNTLRFFDPAMQQAISARVALESDIRQGLLRAQFTLVFQPQVNHLGQVFGAEALLRWPHPTRGMVPPLAFISLAEDTGLIVPLGQWVLETACEQLVRWSAQPAFAHLTLSVNVSMRQFRQSDFVDQLLNLLDYTGATPQRLKLELTESLLVHDMDDTIAKMSTLKRHGVSFSLDDFGTGYSSLSYLKRLPIDQLKIDQSFVRDLLTDPNDAAIARTVVALGHSLGLAVIAEGVETAEQRDFLAAQGCDAYQGYLFGRPEPLAEFEQRWG